MLYRGVITEIFRRARLPGIINQALEGRLQLEIGQWVVRKATSDKCQRADEALYDLESSESPTDLQRLFNRSHFTRGLRLNNDWLVTLLLT